MDVKFPSLTVYFSPCSEDILQIADVVRKETFNIVFHFSISSFCFLLIHWKSDILHYVSRHRINCRVSVCILTVVVVYTSQNLFFYVFFFPLDFLLQLACSSLMPRGWFTDWSSSKYQWLCPFRTSVFCFNTMFARLSEWFQLQWLDCIQKVIFFTILDREKWSFSASAAFAI